MIELGLNTRESAPGRVEHRQGGYEGTLLAAFLGATSGQDISLASGLASVEIASGLWARGFAAARVTPENPRTASITASVRACLGRELARRGEAVFVIEIVDGELSLIPSGSWDVYGRTNYDWVYRVSEYGPSGTRTRKIPATGIVHARYATSPARPWLGRSPVSFASLTAGFAAKLEEALKFESQMTVAQIIPVPENAPKGDDLVKLKDAITALEGGLAMPTGSVGSTTPMGSGSPITEAWKQHRLGPVFTESEIQVRADIEKSLLAAYGIPSSLVDPRAAAGSREGFRQFLHGTLRPIAEIVAEELAEKLDEPDLRFHFEDLAAADITGRAKAYATLIEANMDDGEARRLAGLE